jgi:hypothetical protein
MSGKQKQQSQPDGHGMYFVRVHESLVKQLRESPSEPVTVQIEERGGRELMFVFTRHDCPAVPALQPGDAE